MNAGWWRGRWRWLAAVSFVAAIAGAILSRYQGLIFPVRIASGSMALTLLGPHRELQCGDCGFPFVIDAQGAVPLDQATCPNCGFRRIALSAEQLRPGQRVLIDRWAYWNREPARGDIVAFRDPTDSKQLAVKRIIGLPGETIAIRHGELFIDAHQQRKTLAQASETASIVHDDSFRTPAAAKLPSRWRGEGEASGWRAIANGYAFCPDWVTPPNDRLEDWLVYHHWPCYASPRSRSAEAPVADNDGYNQGLSRQLFEVSDIWLKCELQDEYEGGWSLRVHDGRAEFQAQVKPQTGQATLLRDGEPVETATVPKSSSGETTTVQFGILDQQVFLLLNDRAVFWHVYEPTATVAESIAIPLGISSPLELVVTNLVVYRDIFYLGSHRTVEEWSTGGPLGEDEYLLLGDNVPLSTDSRHWSQPGLSRSALLGRVTAGPSASDQNQ